MKFKKKKKRETKKMTINETHKHHFLIADVGDWDLDQDRSIVPSIHSALKRQGIEGVNPDSQFGHIHQETLLKRP